MNTTSKATNKKATKAPALHAPTEVVENAKPDAMAFAVQQLTAPVAIQQPAPTETTVAIQDTPEFKAALAAALLNRVPVTKKSTVAKEPRQKRVEQNGIKRPLAGNGICAQMWAKMDEISAEQKSPCTIKQVRDALPHFNQVNLQGEYASWRKFNGIVGRIVAPVVIATTETQSAE